tara:strand:- start:9765 stop:10169 length:405 start_codon:yes stop_codon:yes gene_type:complete
MDEESSSLTIRQKQIVDQLQTCSDEISGQELHRILINASFNIGLTTVYRNLRTLQKRGVVRCRNLPNGEALYSPVDRDHHHLTCVDCGSTHVLKSCPIKNIKLPKDQENNFQLLFHTLEFFGICKDCHQNKKVN